MGILPKALKMKLRQYKKCTTFQCRPLIRTHYSCGTCKKDVSYCEGCGLTIYEKMTFDFQFLDQHSNSFSAIVSMFDEWIDKLDETEEVKPSLYEQLIEHLIPFDYRRNGL